MCDSVSGVSSSSVTDPGLRLGECVLIHFVDHSGPDIYQTIDTDGHIVLPIIRQVRVAGLTTRLATRAIMKAYQGVGHPRKVSVVRCEAPPNTSPSKPNKIF
ncbi:MAG: polysaccharide biosynthesis/export family protein [Limisphaerales bacterium]